MVFSKSRHGIADLLNRRTGIILEAHQFIRSELKAINVEINDKKGKQVSTSVNRVQSVPTAKQPAEFERGRADWQAEAAYTP